MTRGMEIMIKALKERITALAHSVNGVAALEFALLAPILIVVMYGVYDYGQAMLKKTELRSATRAGAQFTLTGSTDSTAITSVVNAATNLTLSSVTVICNCADTTTGSVTATDVCSALTCTSPDAKLANVSASYSYDFLFGAKTLNLSANTTVRIE